MLFSKKKLTGRLILRLTTLLSIALMFACSQSEYTMQYFTFPVETQPHNNNWEYIGKIKVASNKKPITTKSMKMVELTIHNKSDDVLLKEVFEFNGASIRGEVSWKTFEKLNITLFEVGNKFANDSYNKNLIIKGPKLLITKSYHYNSKNREFIHSDKLIKKIKKN